jgi:hypothetical protein
MHRWKINTWELHMFEELLEGTVRKWSKIITTRKNIFFLKKQAQDTVHTFVWTLFIRTRKHCSYVHVSAVRMYAWTLFIRTRGAVHTYAWTLFIHWNVSRANWSEWTGAGSLTARESRSPLYIYLCSWMVVYVFCCNAQSKSHSDPLDISHYLYSINCPTIICLPSMRYFILWRDTTSELWTPVQFPLYCYHLFTLLALFTFDTSQTYL